MNYTQENTTNFEVAENTPNASKLLSSLRHLDYSSRSAISDIVDNCIDAGAKNIRIRLLANGGKNIHRIEVWDDGIGMDKSILSEAIRLGSDTQKNHQYDLGRYGMGLVTASLSIGELLSVTSLQNDAANEAIQDLDYVREVNAFKIKTRQLDKAESDNFTKVLRSQTSNETKSGTLVALEKIDRWQWTLVSASERNLAETLGQVFRKFLSDTEETGRRIFVNDLLVEAIDPIHNFEPLLLAEEEFEVEGDTVEVKLFELNDGGQAANRSNKLNITNQGFYILRNNREIAAAQDLGLFNRHNDFNLFRAEFIYPGSLDHIMNAGFTKQKIGIEGNQSFHDKMSAFVQPYLKQVRAKKKRNETDNRDKKEDFTDVEKHITRKSHLLNTAKAVKERRHRNETSPVKKPHEKPSSPRSPRVNITKNKRIRDLNSLEVKFKTKSMDKAGPLYSAEMEGSVTIINWNIDHPFYSEFIIPNEGKNEIINPICYLIYSLAQAELISTMESDSLEIIENIRGIFSRNLKVLMN